MRKSESIANLLAALVAAQKEFEPVKFNQVNRFLGNKYADLGALIAMAKPVLEKHNLTIVQIPESDRATDSLGVFTMLCHAPTGEWLGDCVMIETGSEKGKSTAQVAGSIISYLRRYAYGSILGIYTEEDNDGNAPPSQSGNKSGKQQSQKPPSSKPAAAANNTEGSLKEEAAKLGGTVRLEGKTVKIAKNQYPYEWGAPLMDAFVKTKKLDTYHLDGILQKLPLSYTEKVDQVIELVEKYITEKGIE